MPEEVETTIEILRELLETESEEVLRCLLPDFHPADLALAMSQLSRDEATRIFSCLSEVLAADVLAEADEELIAVLTEDLPDQELSDLLEEMEPDDAADVVGELEDEGRARRVLDLMDEEDRSDLERLLAHDEESAGGIMTSDYLAFPEFWTIHQAIDFLRHSQPEIHFTYAFTLDRAGCLQGVFPIQMLVWTDSSVQLKEIADPEVIRVEGDMDQEEVARLFLKHDLVSLPVVDAEGKLIGRITSDDVLDVLQEESSEDIFKLAGTSDDELITRSILNVLKLRLPWLLVALLGGIGCSFILGKFEVELDKFTYLAFYLPVIMAMGGNVATQSSTLIVRGLATGQVHSRKLFRTILREARVGSLIGLVCALIAGGLSGLFARLAGLPPATGLVVGLSMQISMTCAGLFGSLVPLTLSRLGVDPAVASGPFISMSNDAMGLLIYLTVARTLSIYLI
ncbi:MAG: magnesium transporter [Candidatus Omnitrophica bacterium]|nr:magnesium transporter [Candidatus Omnitrophota bacterium]